MSGRQGRCRWSHTNRSVCPISGGRPSWLLHGRSLPSNRRRRSGSKYSDPQPGSFLCCKSQPSALPPLRSRPHWRFLVPTDQSSLLRRLYGALPDGPVFCFPIDGSSSHRPCLQRSRTGATSCTTWMIHVQPIIRNGHGLPTNCS